MKIKLQKQETVLKFYCQAIEKCFTVALELFNIFFSNNSGVLKSPNGLYTNITLFIEIIDKLFEVFGRRAQNRR